MSYIKQFGIIIVISMMGELLKELLPFSMPASIYGLLIMLIALGTGIVKVKDVKNASDFLLEIMPILFIPSTVGLMESWGILRDILVPVLIVCIIGTIVVMVITGRVTQFVIRHMEKENNKSDVEIETAQMNGVAKKGDDIYE